MPARTIRWHRYFVARPGVSSTERPTHRCAGPRRDPTLGVLRRRRCVGHWAADSPRDTRHDDHPTANSLARAAHIARPTANSRPNAGELTVQRSTRPGASSVDGLGLDVSAIERSTRGRPGSPGDLALGVSAPPSMCRPLDEVISARSARCKRFCLCLWGWPASGLIWLHLTGLIRSHRSGCRMLCRF
jgi:hypothetical protein